MLNLAIIDFGIIALVGVPFKVIDIVFSWPNCLINDCKPLASTSQVHFCYSSYYDYLVDQFLTSEFIPLRGSHTYLRLIDFLWLITRAAPYHKL